MNLPKPKILVVEDDEDIRDIITWQLEAQNYHVVTVTHGQRGLDIVKMEKEKGEAPFQLYILDWMLPDMSGLDLCQYLVAPKDSPKIPILMVTAKSNPQDIIEGLDAGADDYITKPFRMEIFLARVRALLRRSKLPQPDQAKNQSENESERENEGKLQFGDLSLHQKKFQVFVGHEEIQLTISEFKILRGLMRSPGHVFTRKQLIGEVAGPEVHVGGRTIDTQLVGLRKKLGPCSSYIETIRGIGYKFKECDAL